MACTSQSALNYVKSARKHLVRELQNLSVILENLYQKGFLSDEEVSKIQGEGDDYDKSRKILDSVIKKGEAACYELLRIIDMTRTRSLGRPTPLPEKNTGASTRTKKFDLHHWISCFSFKEETQMDVDYLQGPRPCHRYQAKLKLKAQKLSNEFWNASKDLFEENRRPDLSYNSLVLDTQKSPSTSKVKKLKKKKSKMSRAKKLRTYIPGDKPEISPTDLLKTQENILLVGKPGIGKTAVIREMLRLWAEKDNKELDYMFYFDMREMSQTTPAMNLEDLLFSVFNERDEGVNEVLQDIKSNSENVTIIFDGVTDLSPSVVCRLVEKELLPDAKIIITCRPDDEEDFFFEDCLRVEVKGFSERTIKSYLSSTLCDAQKVLSSLELLTLCHVPMYALMVAACSSSEDSPQPSTVTEIYIDIVRHCLQINSNKTKNKDLNTFIKTKREEILCLAEIAFQATQGKTVNLTEVSCRDSCVLFFLKPLFIKEAETRHAFLHYTLQEFFAAVWLLKNPDEIRNVFQQSLTEEMKHMKRLIPFMCRLLNEKSPSWMKCLIPAEELNRTSDWFFKELITTFVPDVVDTEDSGLDVDTLFLCQCLYESQCPETCIYLLDKLDYRLDIHGESLDPYSCCAVAYVVNQSKERKIRLNLDDVAISEQGMRQLFGCLQNVQWCDPLPQQLWKIFLLSEAQMDLATLLVLDEKHLHLPVEGEKQLFERAVEVMKTMTRKVNVCLYWDRETPVCQSLCESLIEALPLVSSLSFRMTNRSPGVWNQEQFHGALEGQQRRLLLDLCLKAARHSEQSFPNVVNVLLSLFPNLTDLSNLCLDLYQHVRSEGFLSVIPKLRLLFKSAPAVWSINLSQRKTSILLQVLKLQSEKKQVELTGWSHEESEVRSFLQCLPYISQLSFMPQLLEPSEETRFLGNLVCAAAEREQRTGEKIVEQLLSVCRYTTFPLKQKWCDFLLDLYFYETKTGSSVLPSSQSVFQSGPPIWFINLSEGKTSILLEVLKLQSEKKQVELTGWSHEESEVKSFLQCLPYISQLSLQWLRLDETTRFFGNLLSAAAEREQQTGEKILKLLSSVCTYKTFPLNDLDRDDYDDEYRDYRCDFLLDLFSKVKDCESKTGLSVLPSLQSVFQSAPAVWSVNLSERKTSILLEVLKLVSEKKQVKLIEWSYEDSEVRIFLQCLPYLSQLGVELEICHDETTRLIGNLFCAAAEAEQQTGEKVLEQLSAACSYETFPIPSSIDMDEDDEEHQSDFLLDLFSYVKDCETETGLSVLPSLHSVFQSAPANWFIDLSRKSSIFLEVLKLQPEKKQVNLTDWPHDDSEMRSFLQCLPYISLLSINQFRLRDTTSFFRDLFCAAAEREQQTGEKILDQLSSVCRYERFPLKEIEIIYEVKYQSDFLLDLFSHLKDFETKTGLSVLPSLLSVFQSAPAVWSINLSEKKTSILLEVLKVQPEKKPVELTHWSHEESEVRNFLQCLPYISQLRVYLNLRLDETTRLFGSILCAAAEREQQTGEKILELLSAMCRYETFPLADMDNKYQSAFLLDLFSHLKDCETKTGLSVLPSLQSVFQSAPAHWSIDLSERKTSNFLEVLKLQSEKKPVELRGWSDEESEVRSFLQCLPYISQFSCGPDFFQSVCSSISVRSRQEVQQLVSLLQLLDFKLLLTGKLSRRTCCSVGRVLQLCGSRVDLSLTAKKMSVRRTSLLFRKPTQLHSLKLSNAMALLLYQWIRRSRLMCPLTVEELRLVAWKDQASERKLLKVVSSLSSLLRSCSVRQLVLAESYIPAQCLIPLLLHHGPPTIKLSENQIQQLLVLVHEVQDQDLTLSLLSAVAGDLTSCCLNWELLHYLLQQSPAQTITVDLRKNLFLQESSARLLPFLGRIVIKRPSPSLVMTSIRELYRTHASHMVPSLLSSLDHEINLSCRELDSVDSAALLFTLRHSDGVKVNLRRTSMPAEETLSILSTLDRVSQLSVDRNQLLRFIHCCASSDAQQEAASVLLRTLQQRLDLSFQSCVDLPEEDQTEPLSLTADDCRASSIVLKHCSRDTQLHLQDCEVEDGGLDLLFPVLDRVQLRVSKSVLLQLLSLIPVHSERDTARRAQSLCGALGGKLDLSHSKLDQRVCGYLVQILDSCEGLTELDLSHCQLSDQLLLPLITHLHKVQVLDLSHNKITDASRDVLLQLISIHSSIHTVRLFRNDIVNRRSFEKHKQFEMWEISQEVM